MKSTRLSGAAFLVAGICLGLSGGAYYLSHNPVWPGELFDFRVATLESFTVGSAVAGIALIVLGAVLAFMGRGEGSKAWIWRSLAIAITLGAAIAIVPPAMRIGDEAIRQYQEEHAVAVKATQAEADSLGLGPDIVKGHHFEYLGAWTIKPHVGTLGRNENPGSYSVLLRHTVSGVLFAPYFDVLGIVEYNFDDVKKETLDTLERAMKNPQIAAKAKELTASGDKVVFDAEVLPSGELYIAVVDRARLGRGDEAVAYTKESSSTGTWLGKQD